MAIIDNIEGLKFYTVQKRIGRPCRVGNFWLGRSRLGEYFESAGIYKLNGRWRKRDIIKMAHYAPHNPRTTAQQNNRQKIANATMAWHALTESEKNYWRQLKYPRKMSGFNRFVKWHIFNG